MTRPVPRSNIAGIAPRAVAAALAGLVAAVGTGCGVAPPPADATCAPEQFLCGRPRNIAHRGGGNLRPENTLVAFTHATQVGADVLELDVRRTADGVVVLMHDPTVDRTTDGVGSIGSMAYAAVEQLDAGARFTADGGTTYPHRGTGVRVPTLQQVLDAFPQAYFSIEIKDGPLTVAPVLELITSRGLGDRVEIASFYDHILAEVRTTAPDVLTTMSLDEMVTFANLSEADEATYVLPAPVAQAPTDQLTDAMLARAQRRHLVLQAWTVDDEATMTSLLARGVDGIITNDPERLRVVIDAMATTRPSGVR